MIWEVIRGDILTPAPNLTQDLLVKLSPLTGTPTAAELATYNAAKSHWSQKNSQGLGLIQATISNVIWQKYGSLSTAKEVLDALETEFGAAGGAQTYLQLVNMMKIQITDLTDLLPQIQQCYHRSNNFRIIIT